MLPVRTLLAGLLAVVAMFLTTSTAWAHHVELISSSPAKGQKLAAAPAEVRLTFSEKVTVGADSISVAGPGGLNWKVGAAKAAGSVVTAPVKASGPAGEYTLTWKVTAADGDATSGKVTFTLDAPAR